jgi:hypothetical protein
MTPSQVENTRISRMPIRKPGSEWPSIAAETMPKSARPCWRVAATVPADTAISVASTIAGTCSFSVWKPQSRISSPTGWL